MKHKLNSDVIISLEPKEYYITLVHYTQGDKRPQKFLPPTLAKFNGLKFVDSKNKVLNHRTTDYVYVHCCDTYEEALEEFYADIQKATIMVLHSKKTNDEFFDMQLTRLNDALGLIKQNNPKLFYK